MKGLISLLLILSPVLVQPNTSDIIRRSVAANKADFAAAPEYSCIERDQSSQLGSDSRVKSVTVNTYQVTMIEGSPYYRLIARDDKPLSKAEQKEEQKKLEEEIASRRSESKREGAKRIAAYDRERKQDFLMISEMASAFNFQFLGEARLDSRDVYEFQATPRPGYRPPNSKAKALTGMRGTLWIDKETYQWVKVEAEVFKPVSFYGFLGRLDPPTRIEFEQMPVGGGIWQPKRLRVKVDARILLLFGKRTDEDDTYSNYQKIGAVPKTAVTRNP